MATATKRKKKAPSYRSFKLSKRLKPAKPVVLPSVLSLARDTCRHIWLHRKTFGGILAVYLVLNIVFVKALSSSINVGDLRNQYIEALGLSGWSLNTALVADVASSGATNELTSLYQTIITIMVILAAIWLFRQTSASQKRFQIREPFYQGMTPIVPFLLVTTVIGLQLLPMLAGVTIYSTVQNNGLAVTGVETVLWALLAFVMSLLTFYFLSSSLFALIIVTLPDMRPIAALRSARKLVAHRRWILMRKIFGAILLASVGLVAILLLTVVTLPVLAEWVALLYGGWIIIFLSGFGYKLYRAQL